MKSAAVDASLLRRILGIRFFRGSVEQAVEQMQQGGLLVVPAAPALKDIGKDAEYREALLKADLVIPDSSFMVMIWNKIEHDDMPRLSGLHYLRQLLKEPDLRRPHNTLWIMASPRSAQRNLHWLASEGIDVPRDAVYLAPVYEHPIHDPLLLEKIEALRPDHIVVTVGGGTQERLGLYLKRNLSYAPSIHCIGAAIAFLSGDQVQIPVWADKSYLGWLYRCISEPKRYVPRYWAARKLFSLLMRYRSELPPLLSAPQR